MKSRRCHLPAVDMQGKHLGAGVMSHYIQRLLFLDDLLQLNIGIQDGFAIVNRTCQVLGIGTYNGTAAAGEYLGEALHFLHKLEVGREHRLGEIAARNDDKESSFKGHMATCQEKGLAGVRPEGGMYLLSLSVEGVAG